MVGESGSGKSVSAQAVMRMVPLPGRITAGQVIFEGQDLLRVPDNEMRSVRGGQIGMIPQNPLSSLNPVITIDSHFHEVLSLHRKLDAIKPTSGPSNCSAWWASRTRPRVSASTPTA